MQNGVLFSLFALNAFKIFVNERLNCVTFGSPTSGIMTRLHGCCAERRPPLSIIRLFRGRLEIMRNCQLWLSLGVPS